MVLNLILQLPEQVQEVEALDGLMILQIGAQLVRQEIL